MYLCSRPAQGGGAGLERYYLQNKTVPEPLLPILLALTLLGRAIIARKYTIMNREALVNDALAVLLFRPKEQLVDHKCLHNNISGYIVTKFTEAL